MFLGQHHPSIRISQSAHRRDHLLATVLTIQQQGGRMQHSIALQDDRSQLMRRPILSNQPYNETALDLMPFPAPARLDKSPVVPCWIGLESGTGQQAVTESSYTSDCERSRHRTYGKTCLLSDASTPGTLRRTGTGSGHQPCNAVGVLPSRTQLYGQILPYEQSVAELNGGATLFFINNSDSIRGHQFFRWSLFRDINNYNKVKPIIRNYRDIAVPYLPDEPQQVSTA